jgi:hypothetical protein
MASNFLNLSVAFGNFTKGFIQNILLKRTEKENGFKFLSVWLGCSVRQLFEKLCGNIVSYMKGSYISWIFVIINNALHVNVAKTQI